TEAQQEGFKKGVSWARGRARPKQLRLLERLFEEPLGIESWLSDCPNIGISWELYMTLHDRKDANGQDVVAFWERVLGDNGAGRIDEWHFALGFINGALEVWDT